MQRALGKLESLFFAYVQLRQRLSVRLGELAEPLGLARAQERQLLTRLARAGLIARVRPGLYLVPSRLPLGGKWAPSEGLALDALICERGGSYQICGPNAFRRYGFDEQIPNRIYVYNDRISGERTVASLSFSLIKVSSDRLGETEATRRSDGSTAIYSSRVRTLVDAVYDWSRFETLPRAFTWIRDELASGRVKAKDLIRVTGRFGDIGSLRRIGVLLDRLEVPRAALRPLASRLRATSAPIPWNPRKPRRGPIDSRWGVQMNDDIREHGS